MKPEIETRNMQRQMEAEELTTFERIHVSPESWFRNRPIKKWKEMRIKVDGKWSDWTQIA